MSLFQYTIVNQSAIAKTFTYFSASAYYKISVGGFGTIVFDASSSYAPTQDVTGVLENTFVSDAYIPPSGSAWLWNNGEKVQYIKISNTPKTGSNISSTINKAEWIEFSMVGAVDKNGSLLYPTAPSSSIIERYIIGNANDKGTYNSIITNYSSLESSIAVAANTSSTETGFSYIDSQFEIDSDCDPLLNNATEPRTNEWLQDVDYSVNAIIPINFDQLINFTATKAAVPQSNYTQLGFVHSRYVGSSTTRNQINEYNTSSIVDIENKFVYNDEAPSSLINKGKGSPLGKIPNVELNNAYIAYFDRILDPYPILNNKVAYYVKYLIDEGGNILDPSISDTNFSISKDTFQLKDYDNKPTRINTAVSNIEQGKELAKLTVGLSSVYKVGAYPSPILYTQISSVEHADSIIMSGSRFLTALGVGGVFTDFGANIFATQSSFPLASSQLDAITLPDTNLTYVSASITFTDPGVGKFTTSSISTAPILFPHDPNGTPPNTSGSALSDNYTLNGSFIFTTSTIPARYSGDTQSDFRKRDVYYGSLGSSATKPIFVNLKPYQKPPTTPDTNINNYILNTTDFKVNAIKLTITVRPGESSQEIKKTLNLIQKPVGYGDQWVINSTGLVFTPDSLYIEDLILKELYNQPNVTDSTTRNLARVLIGGGWGYFGGSVKGTDGVAVKYDWGIDFEQSNFFQGSGFYLKVEGGFNYTQGAGRHGGFSGNKFADDVFLWYNAGGESGSGIQWKRTFSPNYNLNPAVTTPVYSKPILKYFITSPFSSAGQVKNAAPGPFWRRYPDSVDELYMSSSILNQTYYNEESKKFFVQAHLPYVGAVSTDFPLTIEPSFIEFEPVTDFWEMKEGDEIRFENNENLTYKVTSIDGREPVIKPGNVNSNLPADKLRVVVTPPFEYTASNGQIVKNQPSNFDFFVVRRYKENRNFIILDQQMPYGIISTGKGEIAFSGEDASVGIEPVNPSSSPGLLLPQYRVSRFNTNPDLILKDLIEKGIVT